MTDDPRHINTVGPVSGQGINIVQVYAPGAIGMRAVNHFKVSETTPFSVDWLIYSQESIPFFGREQELEALNAFLQAPQSFCWWAVVGVGGTGKSRLAFEFTHRLPDGWKGGFIAKENINLRDAVTWQPEANALWVVDYAAGHYDALREIIAALEQRYCTSPFKIRWLLLERGFSERSGWWSELTGAMNSSTAAVRRTLYDTPLGLPPLAQRARAFLAEVCKRADENAHTLLMANLASVGDEWLMRQSQYGNPLLLQLIVAEFLSNDPSAIFADAADANGIVERYLGRELDILRKRCDEARIDFRSMIRLLFTTTSVYPINVLQDHDNIIISNKDELLMYKEEGGEVRPPTVAELRAMGFDIDEYRRQILNSLSKATNIEDVEEYLFILDEAGLARVSRYAVQPDIVGEALIQLVLNAPNVRSSLKRRRGEFDRKSVVNLIDGCLALSYEDCAKNWARLDDDTLLTFSDYLRLTGKTIRNALLALRRINQKRPTKVKFDPDIVFASNSVHPDAPEVGLYFAEVLQVIGRETLDGEAASRLAKDRRAWVLPYVNFLLDLTLLQKARLGLIACEIKSESLLSRLTNLSNFLHVISDPLRNSFSRDSDRGAQLSVQERIELARLTDGAIEFGCAYAYPTIVAAGDKEFTDLYTSLSALLVNCSFYIANQLLGRTETLASRQCAQKGLEVARLILRDVPNKHTLANVDRNLALLKVADISHMPDALSAHLETLEKMECYATAEDFTGAIVDVFSFHGGQGNLLVSIQIVLSLLPHAPQHLILGELLVEPVVQTLMQVINEQGDYRRIKDTIYPLCSTLLTMLRETDSDEVEKSLSNLMTIAVNATNDVPELWKPLADLFLLARSWMDDDICSDSFIDIILRSAARYALVRSEQKVEGGGIINELPFSIKISEINPVVWKKVLKVETESNIYRHIESIYSIVVTYISPRNEESTHYAFPVSIADHSAAKEWLQSKKFQEIEEKLEEYFIAGQKL